MPGIVHGRLRVGGSIYGDARWSVGLAVTQADGTDPFADFVTNVQGNLETWADNVRALNSNGIIPSICAGLLGSKGTVDTIRTARIGEDGRESAVALIQLGSNPVTGSSGYQHDASTALVTTLASGRPGPSYRGRMYWPAITCALGQDGRVPAAFLTTLAGDVATWLRDAAQALPTGGTQPLINVPAVVSSTKGSAIRVTAVRVGNRLDSQRRRTEGQQEAYSSSAVPT